MNQWKQLLLYILIFVYTQMKKPLIKFLTIRKLELDFTNLFNHGKNNKHSESFIEAWEKEMCIWDVNSVIFKNRYKKAKNRKILAKQFSVLVLVLASHTSLD